MPTPPLRSKSTRQQSPKPLVHAVEREKIAPGAAHPLGNVIEQTRPVQQAPASSQECVPHPTAAIWTPAQANGAICVSVPVPEQHQTRDGQGAYWSQARPVVVHCPLQSDCTIIWHVPSMRQHVPAIGQGFEVHEVCEACGARLPGHTAAVPMTLHCPSGAQQSKPGHVTVRHVDGP